MKQTDEQALEALLIPGQVVAVDPRSAEELGAFEEDALSEEEALESGATEAGEG